MTAHVIPAAREVREPDQVEDLGGGILRVPLRTWTLPPATRTNHYIVRTSIGWVVVDAGSADAEEQAVLDAELEGALADGAPLIGLLVTHHHGDHVAGVDAWRRRWAAPVMAHPATIRLVGAPGWQAFEGEEQLGDATIVHTPGHASGHLALLTGGGDLVSGDTMAGMGTIVVDPPDGSMSAYLRTLDRMEALRPVRALPSHGPTIADAVDRIRAYRAHRLDRERRVVEALWSVGPGRVEALVGAAYPELPTSMHGLAMRSLLAHLIRLSEEDRAMESEGVWSAVGG